MCEFLGVSRSGYYDWRKRKLSQRAQTDSQLKPIIQRIYDDGEEAYGSPRIFKDLKKKGYAIGRKRVERLMREMGLVARVRRSLAGRLARSAFCPLGRT